NVLTARSITSAGGNAIELSHGTDVCHQPSQFGCVVSARRHRRARDSSLNDSIQIAVRGNTPKLIRAQIDPWNGISIGSMAGDAVCIIKIEPGLHVRLRILANMLLTACQCGDGQTTEDGENKTRFVAHAMVLSSTQYKADVYARRGITLDSGKFRHPDVEGI